MNKAAWTRFKAAYEECFTLYPDAASLPVTRLYYLHRQWIFPGHLDPMLTYIQDFHIRFFPDANLEVCLLAGLLHDTGLVHGRQHDSPKGHELRSCDYAETLLAKLGYSTELINQVVIAIGATDPTVMPKTDEATIVRNADAYSHLSTLHFIAKAHFAENLLDYIQWFDAKIHSCFDKLTIPLLIEEKKAMLGMYESQLELYSRNTKSRFIDKPETNEKLTTKM